MKKSKKKDGGTTAFSDTHRNIVGLLSLTLLVGLGERMGERFLPLYLLALGGGIFSVGTFNFLQNLLNALSSYPAGWLTDKLGVRRALMAFALAAVTGYLLVIFSSHWPLAVIGFVIILTWSAVSLPAAMSLVSQVLPSKKRTVGVALHSLVRRFPMALGPILAGLFVDSHGDKDGVRLALYLGLAFCITGGFVLQSLLQVDKSEETKPMGHPLRLFKKMAPDLKEILISDILIRFCEQIPYPFVILWCMRTIAQPVSGFQFGILTAVEMITAALVYLPVAKMADQAGKRPFVLITFFFFTAFPVFLYFSQSFFWLVLAFILRGLKEFGEPARKALILDLCPADQKAGMFGFYYLLRDTVVSLAALGGAFLWAQSPQLNLFMATGFGLLGTLWFWLKGREV